MIRFALVLPALLLLTGCESLSEVFVRQMFTDHGVSRRYREQIRRRLEKRESVPAENLQGVPAPPFLDQG